MVGKEKSVRCGVHGTKVRVASANSPKKMLYHSDLLKLCLMKIQKISDFFPDTTFFMIKKLAMQTNGIKK